MGIYQESSETLKRSNEIFLQDWPLEYFHILPHIVYCMFYGLAEVSNQLLSTHVYGIAEYLVLKVENLTLSTRDGYQTPCELHWHMYCPLSCS